MKKKLLKCLSLFTAALMICSGTVVPCVIGISDPLICKDALLRPALLALGSPDYVRYMNRVAGDYGNRAALNTIMIDVKKSRSELISNPGNDLRLNKLISLLIYKIGDVDEKIHYFRNDLNLVPESLDKLLEQNLFLPPSKRWKLLTVGGSIYHLQGTDGIYNLKFISADGFHEAVYNKQGVLLTEKIDPINMGTFNYAAGIPVKGAHKKYDITPYLEWGNAQHSLQKGNSAINTGTKLAMSLCDENSADIMEYRFRIMNLKLGELLFPVEYYLQRASPVITFDGYLNSFKK